MYVGVVLWEKIFCMLVKISTYNFIHIHQNTISSILEQRYLFRIGLELSSVISVDCAQIIIVLPLSRKTFVTQCHLSQSSFVVKYNQVFRIICMRYQINNIKKFHLPLYFDRQNQLYCSLCLRDHLKRYSLNALVVNIRLTFTKS